MKVGLRFFLSPAFDGVPGSVILSRVGLCIHELEVLISD